MGEQSDISLEIVERAEVLLPSRHVMGDRHRHRQLEERPEGGQDEHLTHEPPTP